MANVQPLQSVETSTEKQSASNMNPFNGIIHRENMIFVNILANKDTQIVDDINRNVAGSGIIVCGDLNNKVNQAINSEQDQRTAATDKMSECGAIQFTAIYSDTPVSSPSPQPLSHVHTMSADTQVEVTSVIDEFFNNTEQDQIKSVLDSELVDPESSLFATEFAMLGAASRQEVLYQ